MGSYLNSSSGATLCQLHKFGGSSLADTECYLRAAAITAEYSQPRDVIVVSAAGSTTNQLIEWLTQSQRDKMAGLRIMLALRTYQSALIHELLTADVAAQLYKNLIDDFERLAGLLDAKITDAVYAEVVGQGEIWSARLMAALLTQQGINAVWIDSRDFLRAERSALPQIDGDDSLLRLRPLLAQYATSRLVVTGFISRNKKEETVLLGRNGSDYSATQIGALIGAKRVTIWSDVDGVYSADPRKVNDACLLPMLRLDEASELARLAAPVLHARTLQPVYSSDIELLLRNSYRPEQGLTQIERILASGSGAKIVTSHDEVSLIELTIDDGVAFTAVEKALKQFLHREQIRALAVGKRADRRLIQLCYTAEVVASALEKLKEADFPARCQLRSGLSLVALVGAGVGKNPLHCHRFYQQLKDQPVEFICHAQDDISLAAVLRLNSTEFIIQGLHKSLFQAKKRVGLVLFGKGNIGSCWLELFIREQESLSLRSGIEFILAGIADSQKGCFDYEGLDTGTLLADYSHVAKEYDETALLTWMKAHPFDDLAVLDITASHLLAQRYLDFAHCGFHVISANKAAGAARGDSYRQVRDAFSKTGRYWLYNATVGAGLPINHTVRDLRDSGDTVLSISGIFSGTLSWLFQQFDGSTPFTALVEQAWQQGLTEPDPRMDLSGQDVMRKLVILAREAGYDIEPDQVRVESLVPDNLTHGSVDGFFEHGQALDTQMLERLNAAKKRGLVLRYVARFEANGKASIGVEAVEGNHPLAALLPCDNVFAIESRWYRDNPLIIRGPGAGREVTAGAIQSDINRLSRLL